jgi:hypothetical protein
LPTARSELQPPQPTGQPKFEHRRRGLLPAALPRVIRKVCHHAASLLRRLLHIRQA